MRVLVAEDDATSRRILEVLLLKWGYEVESAADGEETWAILRHDDPPALVLLDWMMPGLSGIDICKRLRETRSSAHIYVIMLTAKNRIEDIVAGLDAGADDYVVKPFKKEELQARIRTGARVVTLQRQLATQVSDLREALAEVKTLQGLLPVCTYCRKVRDDRNYWGDLENYVATHSSARISHGVCPECFEKYMKPELEGMGKRAGDESAPRGA